MAATLADHLVGLVKSFTEIPVVAFARDHLPGTLRDVINKASMRSLKPGCTDAQSRLEFGRPWQGIKFEALPCINAQRKMGCVCLKP
jgi:hypothetical protein